MLIRRVIDSDGHPLGDFEAREQREYDEQYQEQRRQATEQRIRSRWERQKDEEENDQAQRRGEKA